MLGQPLVERQPKAQKLLDLPYEMVVMIVKYLDPQRDVVNVMSANSVLYSLLKSNCTLSDIFLSFYGKGQAIYHLYTKHQGVCSVALIRCMMAKGANFPRFLSQMIVQDVCHLLLILILFSSSCHLGDQNINLFPLSSFKLSDLAETFPLQVYL